jgi:hypothetical protein
MRNFQTREILVFLLRSANSRAARRLRTGVGQFDRMQPDQVSGS